MARAGHLNCEKQDGTYRPLYGLNKSEEGYNIPRIPEQCDGAQLCASINHAKSKSKSGGQESSYRHPHICPIYL